MWCLWQRWPGKLLSNLVTIQISKLWRNYFPGGARSVFFVHKEEVWVCRKSKDGGILQVMAKYLQQNYIRNSSFWFQPQQLLSSKRVCSCIKTMQFNVYQLSCFQHHVSAQASTWTWFRLRRRGQPPASEKRPTTQEWNNQRSGTYKWQERFLMLMMHLIENSAISLSNGIEQNVFDICITSKFFFCLCILQYTF